MNVDENQKEELRWNMPKAKFYIINNQQLRLILKGEIKMSINQTIKDVVFLNNNLNKSTYRNNIPTNVYHPQQMWTEITDLSYPGVQPWYLISSFGQVYSKLYKCILRTKYNNSGYEQISLRLKNNTKYDLLLHRIMMIEFSNKFNRLPENFRELTVNHLDCDTTHNYLFNLEWASYSENNRYIYSHGNGKVGSQNILCTKYNEEIVSKICEALEKDMDVHQIAEYCNLEFDESVRATIKQIAKGNNWKCVSNNYNISNSRYNISKVQRLTKDTY